MNDQRRRTAWLRAVFGRALLLGMALGGMSTAGSLLIGGGTPGAGAVVIATACVAAAIGVWAGAPEAQKEEAQVSGRWLSAAALAALGGTFATFRTLYEPMLPGFWWPVATLLLLVAIPIYGAALVAPVLLAWSDSLQNEGEAGGVWGGLGPLAVAIPLGTGIGVAVANLAAIPVWGSSILMMGATVLLILPVVLPSPLATEAPESDLYRTVSPFGELRVAEVRYPGERQPERRLYLNGEEESSELVRSGAPTLAYIAAAESWLSAITPQGARFLFLGGGAYTLPRRVAERDPRAKIVVVELDPEVTRVAQRFFGLKPAHAIATVYGDARAYLDRAPAGAFDRIFVDVYGGDERLPHSLLTEEAVQSFGRALSEGGVVAANVIGVAQGEEQRQLWSIIRTFASVIPNVAVYSHLGRDFPDRQNFLLAGSFDLAQRFPDRAGHFDRWPNDEWPAVEGITNYRDLTPPLDPASPPARSAAPAAPRPRGQTTN